MSYAIELVDEHGNVVQVDRHREGSKYMISMIGDSHHRVSVYGTTDASIDITYNYAKYFRETIDEDDGIRWLYGKNAKECVPRLHGAIRELGTVQDDDYWLATPGNTGHILSILLKWAKQHPEAVFRGD